MFHRWLRRYRIPLSFLFGIAVLLLAKPSFWSILGGVPSVTLGVALRTWSSGYIEKNKVLATGGPYAYTRNPLYLGSFLIGLGFAAMVNRPLLVLLFLLAFFGVYRAVIEEEEAALARRFGEAYRTYSRQIPRFFPRWSGHRARQSLSTPMSRFDWRLVIKHREYYAWFGTVMGLGWLLWRMQ